MVVVTSLRAARRRLGYESWHLLHLYGYLGLALPHQLWTGQEFCSRRQRRSTGGRCGQLLLPPWSCGGSGCRCGAARAIGCGSPQPLLRGEPVPVNGPDAAAGHTGFGVELDLHALFGAPDRQLTFSCLALPPQDRRRG
jgi:hypothetical protein